MIGTTTVFKNDAYFLGDVVLTTEEFDNVVGKGINVTVVVIPNDLANCPSGGGMQWDLTINKGEMTTNEEVFAEIKKEEYDHEGLSETIDVLEVTSPNDLVDPKELEEFRAHLDTTVHEVMDAIADSTYESRFDIKIEVNRKRIAIPMHADVFDRLTTFIEEEIEEAKQ